MHFRGSSLNERLLNHNFGYDAEEHSERYVAAKALAEHYAKVENAMVVLSNMAQDISYICYGNLGNRLQLGDGCEEVESIWEKKILDRIHAEDVAEKIAWELQFLNFIKQVPLNQRPNYYLQHFLRIQNAEGTFNMLRHRIFYLDYDTEGNVLLVLCIYTAVKQNQGQAGIVCSLDDTLVRAPRANAQGILSERECKVLELIRCGQASKQIAEALCISVNTVNNHRQNIMRKLRCRNTTEAVEVARRLGLLNEG